MEYITNKIVDEIKSTKCIVFGCTEELIEEKKVTVVDDGYVNSFISYFMTHKKLAYSVNVKETRCNFCKSINYYSTYENGTISKSTESEIKKFKKKE
jgi:hypothetical protein